MKPHFMYLKYVIRHKWFVFVACMKVDPWRLLWRAIKHDWHKFTPAEWGPYVDYFYKEFPKFAEVGVFHKEMLWDKYTQEWAQDRFDRAWLNHQHKGDHHWQHWVLREDDGSTKVVKMPFIAMLEMICDWRGAGKAIHGRDEVAEWYTANKDKMILHPSTRHDVEIGIGIVPFGKFGEDSAQ